MDENKKTEPISAKEVLYRTSLTSEVSVRRDVTYRENDDGALTLDLYHRRDRQSMPAVVIVGGFPDGGYQKVMGCKFKDMRSSVSWARLMAASGMAAITYSNRDPVADVAELLRFVRRNAARLGVDENRIGLWASSGNVPLALSLLMREHSYSLTSVVLCYGYMLDSHETSFVADAASTWKFVNPCLGRKLGDIRPNIPMLLVRAGRDEMPHLNETIDRFVDEAIDKNLPLTLVNHPDAPHAFDLLDDSPTTRRVIRQMLFFMQTQFDREV